MWSQVHKHDLDGTSNKTLVHPSATKWRRLHLTPVVRCESTGGKANCVSPFFALRPRGLCSDTTYENTYVQCRPASWCLPPRWRCWQRSWRAAARCVVGGSGRRPAWTAAWWRARLRTREARKLNSEVLLRPIYTEMLPGVAVHDSLFVLLRPGVAVPRRARAQNYPTQQNNQRIAPGTSSVQIGL